MRSLRGAGKPVAPARVARCRPYAVAADEAVRFTTSARALGDFCLSPNFLCRCNTLRDCRKVLRDCCEVRCPTLAPECARVLVYVRRLRDPTSCPESDPNEARVSAEDAPSASERVAPTPRTRFNDLGGGACASP